MRSVLRGPASAGKTTLTPGELQASERRDPHTYKVDALPALSANNSAHSDAAAHGDGFTSPPWSSLSPCNAEASSRDLLLALTYGLELVQAGAVLVAGEGQLMAANRKALSILEKKDGIVLARTGLVADRASDTRLLHRLLEDAIAFPESGEPEESPFPLQRKFANSALIVRVLPGPGLTRWSDGSRTALLKIYDHDLGLIVDERALSCLYGLTRGEAALATRLLRGRSIEEASAELFISPHTARTHLKRIFMKTDTHRQTELVVRMMFSVL